MQPHEQRVIDEHQELNNKLNKLSEFITVKNDTFKNLANQDKALLIMQREIMLEYEDILLKRIQRFDG